MSQNVQSVERALILLEALCCGERGILELAESVDLNKTTTHRLLGTLMDAGYVKQNSDNARYSLTTKMLRFGDAITSQLDIIPLAKHHLRLLSEQTGETVHLVSLEGNQAVYIDKIEPRSSIRMYSYIGKHIPLYCTAVGKVFLAYSKRITLDGWWNDENDNIIPLTDKTITDLEKMKSTIVTVRDKGYAVDDEENELGIYCIGAPIFDYKGDALYALSLSTPKFRTAQKDASQIIQQTISAANGISAEIGGTPPK